MTAFPLWALGLGAGLLASIICLFLSLRTQSYSNRIRVSAYEIERRVRMLTTLALASLLLATASLALGLPFSLLNTNSAEQEAQQLVTATPSFNVPTDEYREQESTAVSEQDDLIAAVPLTDASTTDTDNVIDETSESLAPTLEPLLPIDTPLPTETPADTPTATPIPTDTPTPTNTPTSTPTPTNTPTNTPTPTLTPTPITADTALVNTNGSTLWLRDTPGGQNITLMQDRDLVILEAGNANYAGLVWKEIRTLDGVAGWVERRFLQFE